MRIQLSYKSPLTNEVITILSEPIVRPIIPTIIDNNINKLYIIQALHDDFGHYEREAINKRVNDRYF